MLERLGQRTRWLQGMLSEEIAQVISRTGRIGGADAVRRAVPNAQELA